MEWTLTAQRAIRWWLAAIIGACAMLYAAAAGAASESELPRYKLEVGQQLSYVTEVSSKYEDSTSAPSSYSIEWTALVMDKNADGSWRMGLRCMQKYGQSERANVAACDLYPDGRFSDDPSLGIFVDPSQIFVRLPDSVEQIEKGWSAKVKNDNTTITYSLSRDADRASDRWAIDMKRAGALDAAYELTSKQTASFDRGRGLVEKIATESTQGYGIKSTSTGTTQLKSVEERDGESVKKFRDELTAYLAASQKHDQLERLAYRDVKAGDSYAADAKALWDETSEKTTDKLLKAQIESQAKQSASMASYLAEEAKNRAEIVGKPAAEWEIDDLDGNHHSLADYRGKVVVMDFWYRGCGWCIRSMPQIKDVVAKYEKQPVVMLGMNTDQNLDDARLVIEKMGLNYLTLQATGIPEKYKVRGFPTLVIVDQQGNIHDLHIGYAPDLAEQLSTTIDGLLKSGTTPVAAAEK